MSQGVKQTLLYRSKKSNQKIFFSLKDDGSQTLSSGWLRFLIVNLSIATGGIGD
jgi:hypothetical protein